MTNSRIAFLTLALQIWVCWLTPPATASDRTIFRAQAPGNPRFLAVLVEDRHRNTSLDIESVHVLAGHNAQLLKITECGSSTPRVCFAWFDLGEGPSNESLSLLRAGGSARLLDAIGPTAGTNRLNVYVRGWSGSDEVQSLRIGGVRVTNLKCVIFPEGSGGGLLCIAAIADCTFRIGDDVVVSLRDTGGQTWIGATRVHHGCYLGPSHYDSPLRIVSVDSAEGKTVLRLYNESFRGKPSLTVVSAEFAGDDVTAVSGLPLELPADRQQYDEDSRVLVIPRQLPESGAGLRLEYELCWQATSRRDHLDLNFGELSVELRPEIGLPIGVAGGCTVPGAVCVQHAGLRSPLPVGRFQRDCLRIRGASDVPVYAIAPRGCSATELARHSIGVDFLVSAPGLARSLSPNPIEATLTYLRAARFPCVPVVNTLLHDFVRGYSSIDAWQLFLISIGEGSKGLLSMASGGQFPSLPLNLFQQQRLCGSLGVGYPLRILHQCNQEGLYVGAVVVGTSSLIVPVVDLWSELSVSPECIPMDCMGHVGSNRSGVVLELVVGAAWDVEQVTNRVSGEREKHFFTQDGVLRVHLADFSAGVLLEIHGKRVDRERRLDRASRIGDTASRDVTNSRTVGAPAVVATSATVIDAGLVEPGENIQLGVGLFNGFNDDAALTVAVLDSRSGATLTSRSSFEIPAGSSVLIPLDLQFPRTSAPSETRLMLHSPEAGFELPVNVYALVSPSIRPVPPVVDFGPLRGSVPAEQTIFLASSKRKEDWLIDEIKTTGVGAVASFNPNRNEILLRPKPCDRGKFSGTLTVTGHFSSTGKAFSIDIPFVGIGTTEGYMCTPNKLAMSMPYGGRTVAERVITVSSVDGLRFSVQPAEYQSLPLDVSVDDASALEYHKVRVRLRVAPRESLRGELCLDCVDEVTKRKTKVTVPVLLLSTKGRVAKSITITPTTSGESAVELAQRAQDQVSGQIATCVRKAEAVIGRFRAIPLPSRAPNWIRMHKLLTYPGSIVRASEGDREVARLLNSILRFEGAGFPPFVVRNGLPYAQQEGSKFAREHHPDQFLCYLAVAGVDGSTPLFVAGKEFEVADLARQSQLSWSPYRDSSWTAVAFAKYLSGDSWKNKYGADVRIKQLASSLLDFPSPYCGGTHKLFGLVSLSRSYALGNGVESYVRNELAAAMRRLDDPAKPVLPDELRKSYEAQSKLYTPATIRLHYGGHLLESMAMWFDAKQLVSEPMLALVTILADSLESEYASDELTASYDHQLMAYGAACHAASGLARWIKRVRAEELLVCRNDAASDVN